VAWRDVTRQLRVAPLLAGEPITLGRAAKNTIVFDAQFVSREHAEVVLRTQDQPDEVSVLLLDEGSKHGTEHRPLALDETERPTAPLLPVPSQPALPLRLQPGEHDVRLAGEVWVRIGGVPVDRGDTDEHDYVVPRPTPREHDVLVELCRPRYQAGRHSATPSNAEIATRLVPMIGASRVSDILSQLYAKYGFNGTTAQNRLDVVDFAIEHRLVGPQDYV
jgi:hypothetical protein